MEVVPFSTVRGLCVRILRVVPLLRDSHTLHVSQACRFARGRPTAAALEDGLGEQ